MGFNLPGKSIQSGTSAHSSALKMVAEQKAASALKAKQEAESPVKASEFGAEYRKNRDAGKKYFTYKGKEYTTESKSEKAAREKRGTSYASENPKKSMTKTLTTKKDDPLTESIKKSNPKKAEGPKTQKQTIKDEKQDVKDVRKSGKESVKSAKKQKRVDILKAKKDVADAKGKSRRSERLERKIERKEGTKTRKEQRQERRQDRKDKRMAKKGYVRKEEGGETPAKIYSKPKGKRTEY